MKQPIRIPRAPRRALVWLGLAAALAVGPVAQAADDAPRPATPAAAADPLGKARGYVKAANWTAAGDELKRVNATGDADWNNLMGYVARKQAKPDLEASQRYYDTALRINPKHTGALEYSGELALMKGDLATAEARLATLAGICSSPCEPLDDLKASIARYKAKS